VTLLLSRSAGPRSAGATDEAQRAFAGDGPVAAAFAALGRAYAGSDPQAEVARAVAGIFASADAAEPASRRRLGVVEAGTGVGKSLGALLPVVSRVLRTGRPALVATHTLALQRQLLDREIPAALEAVARGAFAEGLPARRGRSGGLRIAVRRGRQAFPSPSRMREHADAADEAGDRDGARALRRLAEAADRSLADAAEVLAEGEGSIEAARRDPAFWSEAPTIEALQQRLGLTGLVLDVQEVCLLDASPGHEQSVYELCRRAAAGAELVLCTHAALALDLSTGGGVVAERDGDGRPKRWSSVLLDEADRWPAAAASALTPQLALSTARRLAAGLAGDGAAGPVAAAAADLEDAARAAEILVDGAVSAFAAEAARGARAGVPTAVGFAALPGMEALAAAMEDRLAALADALAVAGVEGRAAQAASLATTLRRIRGGGDDRHSRIVVRLSPVRRLPSLARVPFAAGRLLGRLWRLGGADPEDRLADAVVCMSATLATPDAAQATAWSWFEGAVGAAADDVVLRRRIEPDEFGRVRGFVLASPDAPTPDVGDGAMSDAYADHVAGMLAAAAADAAAHAPGNARVLALCASYADVDAVAAGFRRRQAAGDGAVPSSLLAHDPGTPLAEMARRYRADPRAILLTPAAWEGLDLPGLVPALFVVRLPFPPPDETSRARLRAGGREDVGRLLAMDGRDAMLRRLRQGFGRAIRTADDETRIWVADPRFGLPPGVAARVLAERGEVLRPHREARPAYLAAVPARFADVLARAAVHVPERPAAADPSAAPPRGRRRRAAGVEGS
jgi:ATP-dependent DNA helicase DinG